MAKGVGCATCHGRVDQMHFVYQEHTLLMEWCLDCHRRPQDFVRPRDQVFNMAYEGGDRALGEQLVRDYHIREPGVLTSCSTCHR